MSNFGNWPLLDRLNNYEFFSLLPHLGLEHSFLTQIFVSRRKWIYMLDANFQTLQVQCGCCAKQIGFEDIKKHLTQTEHLMSLRSNVKQFYQPFYTFGKEDIKLARGEHVSQESREMALRELNTQMDSFRKDCILAKEFADIVQKKAQEAEDGQVLQLSLEMKVDKPERMFVTMCLPFKDIPKFYFCKDVDGWQPVLSYKYLTQKANFHCNICTINCSGIVSLNSHLNGYTHKLKQLELLALRYEENSKINKNCCVQFGDTFSYSVKENARQFFVASNNIKLNLTNPKQLVKLSKEVEMKVNALNKYVPKIFSSNMENNVINIVNNAIEDCEKFKCAEYLGHLGVEYVLRIMKNDYDQDPKFECGLCEFLGDGNKMQRHLLNYDHKKKYLDLHYFDTIKKYESALGHMRYMEFRAVISEIVDKISVEVEKQHSRSLPYTVSIYDYKVRRPDLIAKAYALLHASHNRGPSFSNVLSSEDLKNLKNSAAQLVENKTYKPIEYIIFTVPPNKVYLNQLNHDPVIRLKEYTAKINKNRTTHGGRFISPTNNQDCDRSNTSNHEHRSRSRSPIFFRSRTPEGKHLDVYKSSNDYNRNIWDIYRREVAATANEIEMCYEGYRKNPESHPLYEEEWNDFWQRRKKDLEREGINHRTYNFQPEWVHYFKQRIEVLFGEALHKSQLNVRQKLGIPLDAEEDAQRQKISIEYLDERSMNEVNRNIEETNELKTHSRRSSLDYKGRLPHKMSVSGEGCVENNIFMNIDENEMIIRDNHSNVVHVLRLIIALEGYLGSLGEKIIELLSIALQMEKNFQGSSAELEANFLTTSNCQILETAVEKLKGILFAGLLDENKISAFDRVIRYTTNLLKYAEKMGWRQDITVGSTFNSQDSRKIIQEDMNSTQIRGGRGVNQISNEKPLSDTLMDLMNTPQITDHRGSISKERHSISAICPPPPTIKDSKNSNPFAAWKGQTRNSGLASFDTKLSLDTSSQTQKQRCNQLYPRDFGQLSGSRNNSNNNSFKNNNETRTNINTRTNTGSYIGGNMNNNSGSSLQFRNSQFIPNMGQNNAMYQGGGGGNRN